MATPRFEGLVLDDVIETQTVLGSGGYSKVVEVLVYGRKFAGRRLYDYLEAETPHESYVQSKLFQECKR